MNTVVENIRRGLRESADQKTRESGERFFREEVRLYGLKAAAVAKIGKRYFAQVKDRDKQEIFALCDELWRSGYLEEAGIASDWAYALRARFAPGDFRVFETWVKEYVGNWAACDTLCNHTVGAFVEMYPGYVEELKRWAASPNRWVRRAAAVSLIIPARRGKFLPDVFAIADLLLRDADDMVQKGYGWLLKAAADAHRQEVFAYVMGHRAEMPRTALRYAIEKMPPELRSQAMAK